MGEDAELEAGVPQEARATRAEDSSISLFFMCFVPFGDESRLDILKILDIIKCDLNHAYGHYRFA